MAVTAPERVEVQKAQLRKFNPELQTLLTDVGAGKYDDELAKKKITVPSGLGPNDIYADSEAEQGVGAEVAVILAIKYSPLLVVMGKDLWAWAWPKIRDRLDGAAKEPRGR
jgi:hypothetical protein